MDWELQNQELIDKIILVEQSHVNNITAYSEIIELIFHHLQIFKAHILKNPFKDKKEEIEFFKKHKPNAHSYLIQYREQLNFETERMQLGLNSGSVYIEKMLNFCNKYLAKHQEFHLYMITKKEYLDHVYFIRNKIHYHNNHYMYSESLDTEFSTGYDYLWASMLAKKRFQSFLKSKLEVLNIGLTSPKNMKSNLNWTGSKVALTELALALQHSGSLNHGNVTFKDTIHFFQNIFDLDLGEFNHTAMRLKNRSHPTKFVDTLKQSLEGWIEKSDT